MENDNLFARSLLLFWRRASTVYDMVLGQNPRCITYEARCCESRLGSPDLAEKELWRPEKQPFREDFQAESLTKNPL